jgi:hypothetical protein
MGFNDTESGEESLESYFERMSGYISLLAALIQRPHARRCVHQAALLECHRLCCLTHGGPTLRAFPAPSPRLSPLSVPVPRSPFVLADGWAWLARVANSPPQTVSAIILDAFLPVAAYELSLAYRKQFTKLLKVLHSQFLPQLDRENPFSRAAAQRLEIFLDGWRARGERFLEPEGRTLPVAANALFDPGYA